MRTYSSFADPSTIRCPGARAPPLNPNITSDTLRRLNWLLNSYYNPQRTPAVTTCTLAQNVTAGWYQSLVGTAAGTYGPITNVDMQAAVWVLTGARCWQSLHSSVRPSDRQLLLAGIRH
jgi:hypothetical protein